MVIGVVADYLVRLLVAPATSQVDAVVKHMRHLALELLEQVAEPLERVNARAYPEEVDALELGALDVHELVSDVLENGGVGRDADAGADQNQALVLEHVLGARAVRTVDAHRLELVLALDEASGPVAGVANVHRELGVRRRRRDRERMPLEQRQLAHIQVDVLTAAVLDARARHVVGNAQLDHIRRMHLVLVEVVAAQTAHEARQALEHVDTNGGQHPHPACGRRAGERGHVACPILGRPLGVADVALLRIVGAQVGLLAHHALQAVHAVERHEDGGERLVRIPEQVVERAADVLVGGGGEQAEDETEDEAGGARHQLQRLDNGHRIRLTHRVDVAGAADGAERGEEALVLGIGVRVAAARRAARERLADYERFKVANVTECVNHLRGVKETYIII